MTTGFRRFIIILKPCKPCKPCRDQFNLDRY